MRYMFEKEDLEEIGIENPTTLTLFIEFVTFAPMWVFIILSCLILRFTYPVHLSAMAYLVFAFVSYITYSLVIEMFPSQYIAWCQFVDGKFRSEEE